MIQPEARANPDAGRSVAARRARTRAIAFGMVGIGIVLLVAALISLGVLPTPLTAPRLTGSVLNPPQSATDFRLEDQLGQTVSLSDFRGKVVVLTFLYTNCPDTCPIITQKLHQARATLGNDATRTAILAVTVDPANDTLAQVRAYSTQKDMLDKWHFLIGAQSTLAPIWAAYGVYAQPDAAGSASVDHAAPVFVIDPRGQMRALLDVDFTPADLVQDVRALLT